MANTGIAVLLLINILVPICEGRIRDSVEECTDNTFIEGIIQCVAYKFEDVLTNFNFGYETESYHTGRHPLAFHEAKDISIRQNYVGPTISKHLTNSHRKILDHLTEIGKAVVNKEYEVMAIEKLKHINFQDVIYQYINDILHHVEPFTKSQADSFYVQSEDMAEKWQCRLICRNYPQFCEICPKVIDKAPQLYKCLSDFSQEDFEDNIRWLQCFYICEDLIPISACIKEHFRSCGKWEVIGDIVIRAFADFTQLDSCLINVLTPQNLTITEGGSAVFIDFYNYMPPGAHCIDLNGLAEPLGIIRAMGTLLGVVLGNSPDCVVQVQMSLQNCWNDVIRHVDNIPVIGDIGRPKCHNKNALRQAVIGNHAHASNENTCIINITNSNWNVTHSVPIWPSVDMKNDGDVTTNLTLKLRVDNQVKFNSKIPITIQDIDIAEVSLCQSSGDPHITTFDGHYYNNLYDGYFYLYNNTHLPFQVQTAYQRCTPGGNASCTCAVAVKSGDDVFVVDKCRRKTESGSDPQLKVVLFVNGELTLGTRIFGKSLGSEFMVILPTGTKVNIVLSNRLINVYVTPSTYDWEDTQGLCGVYDGDIDNDLMLPDGTIYEDSGSEVGEQPRNFSNAWRVPVDDRIFEGSYADIMPELGGPFCKCNHVLIKGVECTCGHGEIVETCDYELDGELYNITAITKKSRKTKDEVQNKNMDDVDMDESFEPPMLDWNDNVVWNATYARAMCESLIDSLNSTNALIIKCKDEFDRLDTGFLDEAVAHCIQDIQITDTDAWKWAALESAKRKCYARFLRGIDLEGLYYDTFENCTCLNDCNGRGICIKGSCVCSSQWTGGDCSLPSSESPVVTMGENSKCDTRYEDCRFVSVFGRYFPESTQLICGVKEAEIDKESGEFKEKGKTHDVDVLYISPYQVICVLPFSGSYVVHLRMQKTQSAAKLQKKNMEDIGESFKFIAYDSACYTCDIASAECEINTGEEYKYCIIDDECYELNETNPMEPCNYCSGLNGNEWSWFESDECNEKHDDMIREIEKAETDQIIRISVACLLTVLIIVLTVVLYFYSKRKNESKDESNQNTTEKSSKTEQDKGHNNLAYTVQADISTDNEKTIPMPTPRLQQLKNSETSRNRNKKEEMKRDILATKVSAQEARKNKERTPSMSSTQSTHSKGIGGGGPLAFTQYRNLAGSDDVEENSALFHYDKGLGAHGTPTITKKPFNGGSVTTWF